MCTYITETLPIEGSAKGPGGWLRCSRATVYFDHPVHTTAAEHTLNLDFADPGGGPGARVAVELTAESARALAEAILSVLDQVPAGLLEPAATAS